MAEAASQGTISALNHNGESFGQDNTDMAILKKVSMLEAQKEALHMQIVILREDSKAQEAKNQAELAQVQASAKSEIEHVKANAAAESEKDSRVLMKIVKKLRVDIDEQKAKNKAKIEHVKANAAVESKKVSSLLLKMVRKHKKDSTAQKAKNKAELAQVKAQASVDIEQVKDNAAAESKNFLKVSSHEDLIKIVKKLKIGGDAQCASTIDLGLRRESLEEEAHESESWNPCFLDATERLQTEGLSKVRNNMNTCAESKSLRNTLQHLEWCDFKALMQKRTKLNAQGGCPASLPTAASVVDQWIFTHP